MQPTGQQSQRLFQFPAAHPLLEPAMAGLEGRILLRQLTPLRPRAKHPQHTIQHRARVMPRTATIICPPSTPQDRLDDQPLFIGQLPASCHSAFAGSQQSNFRMHQFYVSKVYETGSSQDGLFLIRKFTSFLVKSCTSISAHRLLRHYWVY